MLANKRKAIPYSLNVHHTGLQFLLRAILGNLILSLPEIKLRFT